MGDVSKLRARTVVVGGGVMGVSIAMHLAERLDPLTDPVLLFERRALGSGSTGRSGAILRQFYSSRELAGMARDSLRVYADFERRTGRSVGFQRTGVLTLAGPARPADLALLRDNVATMSRIGIDVELVDARRIASIVPGIELAPGTLGAWEPGAGQADPLRALESFAAVARGRGATLRLGREVSEILVAGGRVRGVRCGDETVEADHVVVAAGPWTRALFAAIGVDLPLQAVRPEQHFLAMPEPPPGEQVKAALPESELDDRFGPPVIEPAVAHPVLLDLERGYYARCESPLGRTRIGSMDVALDARVQDPDRLDEAVSPQFSAWARERLEGRLPVYRERPDRGSQAALYTMTPDAQAVIGEIARVRGLYVVSGFSGHGFKLGPSIGEGVAQLLCGERVSAFDPAFFAPSRFDRARDEAPVRGFGL